MKKLKPITQTIILSALVGAVFATAAVLTINKIQPPTEEDLIKDFYFTENAVHVSPHGLRKQMSKGQTDNYVLVDLRSPEEYEKEHIVTAINIPAYKDANTSAYGERDRIINSFQALPKDKEVIVYCYSMPCMTGRKIGKMLAENNIYVKHLGIGWNEWRYSWDLWNHDSETPTIVEDYIVSGSEPGAPPVTKLPPSCGIGEFGC
ncbi:rhodanese-like domain-containing protein [Patescibacteria group bacterium]|nr:rhodanese-like domain-containing protein [Patescibacteria group bacterium]